MDAAPRRSGAEFIRVGCSLPNGPGSENAHGKRSSKSEAIRSMPQSAAPLVQGATLTLRVGARFEGWDRRVPPAPGVSATAAHSGHHVLRARVTLPNAHSRNRLYP